MKVVILHGAYHGPESWASVKTYFEHESFKVEVPSLEPSIGNLETRLSSLETTLSRGAPNDTVMVAHSLGGLFAVESLYRWPGSVGRIIFVAAYIPMPGQRVSELAAADRQTMIPAIRQFDPINKMIRLDETGAAEALFIDLPKAEAAVAAKSLRPHLISDFLHQAPQWRAGKTRLSYIICSRDKAINPVQQQKIAAAAGCLPIVELDCGHMPMVSAPGALFGAVQACLQD